jgi:hypothetical protein
MGPQNRWPTLQLKFFKMKKPGLVGGLCITLVIGILWYGVIFETETPHVSGGLISSVELTNEELERIFHPKNHHDEFLHSMLITDMGLIQDYESGAVTFYDGIPEEFWDEMRFTTHINNREYHRTGSLRHLLETTYTGITTKCLGHLHINLFTTAMDTQRGPGKVTHNLISTLHAWGLEPGIKQPYALYSTNLMLDYWGSPSYDELLFVSGLSPGLNTSRKAR